MEAVLPARDKRGGVWAEGKRRVQEEGTDEGKEGDREKRDGQVPTGRHEQE